MGRGLSLSVPTQASAAGLAADALPRFGHVAWWQAPVADGPAQEQAWLGEAATRGRPAAHLWQGAPGLVVPRRYTALPGWAEALARSPERVQVRASGGGLVPQGPGVWNLTLAWPAAAAVPQHTDAVYQAFCAKLAAALARVGVVATPQPVAGSFCDGRYNLAVRGAKLAGTAQAWRRLGGRPMVLVHAVLVTRADPAELTARANAFEAALGSGVAYRAEALTSVARAAPGGPDPVRTERRVLESLAEQFAEVVPPTTGGPPADSVMPTTSTETTHGPA